MFFRSFEPFTPRLQLARFRLLDLMLTLLLLLLVLVLVLAVSKPARADNTTIFLTDRNGQIPFPIGPPNRATGGPGSIDNMTIGASTPRPGTFTNLNWSGSSGGAGLTSLFASPPAIGGTAPAAGNFTGLTTTDGLVCATYNPSGTPAATDAVFFIATRAYIVVSVSEVHSVAAGGASKLQVVKDTSTDAPGAGTDLLTNNTNTGFDLNGTANTVQTGTLVAQGTRTLAAGDRLSVDYANAIQSSAGVVVTACMAPR